MWNDNNFTVLIVDDSKFNLKLLNDILKNDYDVITTKSGESALSIANKERPDLILLDIILPDMSGYDVLKELKASDVTKDIPIIFITGLDSVEDEEKGFALGAVDYIVKPFKSPIVKARVRTHLKIVRQMRTIEQLGMIDALTEIPNRRNYNERMRLEWGRSMREKEPLSVMMLDIDKFKLYNDTYGHLQGDLLLQSTAKVIRSSLGRLTDFAGRFGGEEFVVILPNTDMNGALIVAERIRTNIEKNVIFNSNNEATHVTASIGVASIIPTPDGDPADFLNQADTVLYKAKNSGRNQVCS